MNYLVKIDKTQCEHERWGIDCERNVELTIQLNNVAKMVMRAKEEKEELQHMLFNESINLAKNKKEELYICFFIGSKIGKVESMSGENKRTFLLEK